MRLITVAAAVLAIGLHASADTRFNQTNLVTDDQSVNAAQTTDASLKNAWGLASSSTSPLWVSDNATGLTTVYRIDPLTQATTKLGITVALPGDGSVTGQVFNGDSAAFNGDVFLFVNEDGTISGWRNPLGSNAEVLKTADPANVYKGIATATVGTNTYLYAANFKSGAIDVMPGAAGAPALTGNFTDPNLPAGYAPFNVQNLAGTLYVAYAVHDPATKDEIAGPGLGLVDAFDTQGNLLGRVATAGTLNAPWGLAIAPSSFGQFAGDLLVGNFGDGTINAYNLTNSTFAGQLLKSDGSVLAIDGLWGLRTGNNGNAGNGESLYFSAGPNDEANGLLGVINAVPEPTSGLSLLLISGIAIVRRRRAS